MLYTQFPTIYENIQNSTKALGEKWSVVYMNLPSNIQQAITSAGETVSSKAAEFINMKSTPMVDYAGNFAKALPSVFIGIVVLSCHRILWFRKTKPLCRLCKVCSVLNLWIG